MDNLFIFYLIAFLLFCILGLLIYTEVSDSFDEDRGTYQTKRDAIIAANNNNNNNNNDNRYTNTNDNNVTIIDEEGDEINVNTILEDIKNRLDSDNNNSINDNRPLETKPQVFQLSENKYSYRDAQIACKSMGAELATIDQLTEAYNQGANWCNYGWTKDQMALYPIQDKYYKQVQQHPKLKNSCGFPGINGGFFKNDKLLFGATCYGLKHNPKKNEVLPDIVSGNQQYRNENKFFEYKENVPKVAPFSNNKWSTYDNK